MFTVGRLDEESSGLLLVTNDGEFAQRVAHPRFGVIKTYRVRLRGRIDDATLGKVREGVHLSDGKTAGARILIQRRTPAISTLLVSIREGKNRELRRMFARVGFRVIDLVRTDIGPLSVRGLKAGRWRALSRAEVEALLAESSLEHGQRPLHETGRWRGEVEPDSGARPARKGAKPARKKAAGAGTRGGKTVRTKVARKKKTAGKRGAGKRVSDKQSQGKQSRGKRTAAAKPSGRQRATKKAAGKKVTRRSSKKTAKSKR